MKNNEKAQADYTRPPGRWLRDRNPTLEELESLLLKFMDQQPESRKRPDRHDTCI